MLWYNTSPADCAWLNAPAVVLAEWIHFFPLAFAANLHCVIFSFMGVLQQCITFKWRQYQRWLAVTHCMGWQF